MAAIDQSSQELVTLSRRVANATCKQALAIRHHLVAVLLRQCTISG